MTKFLLFIILLLFYSTSFSQKETVLTLEKKLTKEISAQNKVDIMLEIAQHFYKTDTVKAKFYITSSLSISEKNEHISGIAKSYYSLAEFYYYQSDYQLSNEFYKKAIENYTLCNNLKKIADSYVCIGTNYDECSAFEEGLSSYIKAEKIYSQIKDTNGLFSTTYNIGCSYYALKNILKAKECINRAYKIALQLNDKSCIAYCYSSLGIYERKLGNPDNALTYYVKLETLAEEIKDSLLLATAYNNIGNIFNDKHEYLKARQFFLKGLYIAELTKNTSMLATAYGSLGTLEWKIGNNLKAVEYLTTSISLFKQFYSPDRLMTNYRVLSDVYSEMGDFKSAYEYNRRAFELKDSVYSLENLKLMTDMETKYQTQKKEQQIELNNLEIDKKNREVKQQKIIIAGIAGVLLIIIIFSAILFRLFKQKKKANLELSLKNTEIQYKNEEISAQRDEIQAQRDQVVVQRDTISVQQKKITDSIRYARKIQTAVLPPNNYFKEIFPAHFVLYKPRDIVSGDFYWVKQIDNKLYIAVADCTGHGVPGAFMSMMGVAFLNEIVIKLKNLNAGQILDNLRENVKNSLHQNNQNSNSLKNELTVKDGMDISLCIFDNNTYELQFAGANNPIYVINTPVSLSVPDSYRDEDKGAAGLNHTSTPCLPDRQALSVTKNLVELKGDKMPIGIHVGIERPFVTNYIKAEKGAKFYLFSDGYADQFGGPLGKKFMYSRLKQLLLDISNKPLDQQCTILEHTIEKWMADVEQIDDILIIGIEIV